MIRAADALAAFRAAPICDLRDLTGGRPVLVLAPHPDDESLACGGMIAETCARGQDIYVAILTDGTGSHPQSPTWPPARLKALRESEARAAVAELGLPPDRIVFLEQSDSKAPHEGAGFGALVDRITSWARERAVCTICTTWQHDPHCDHEAAAKIATEVARRLAARLFLCPVWGWTLPENHPLPAPIESAARLDITARLPAKRRAIAAHQSQTTQLIHDSPFGFQLPPTFLAQFEEPWEVYIEA